MQEGTFGLTSCRLLAEAQGGRFWIAEAATGGVVCVALPTAAAPSRPGPARTKSGAQLRVGYSEPAVTPQTILVVDDEPLIRTFVSRALKERGYGVIEADCAERAMDRLMLRQQPLALLLSDVGLPGVSGAVLVRQAKRLNPRLPTLLISITPKRSRGCASRCVWHRSSIEPPPELLLLASFARPETIRLSRKGTQTPSKPLLRREAHTRGIASAVHQVVEGQRSRRSHRQEPAPRAPCAPSSEAAQSWRRGVMCSEMPPVRDVVSTSRHP